MFRKLITSLCIFALLTCHASALDGSRRMLLLASKNPVGFPISGAVLDENFVTGQYFPGPISSDIVNTRSSSAYQTNTAGLVSSVGSNVLRISNAGMLIEPAGTYGTWPSVPTAATTWSVFGTAITYNNTVAPDGTTTGALVTTTGTGVGSAFISGGSSLINANVVGTMFFYVKPSTRTAGVISFTTNSNTTGVQANFDTVALTTSLNQTIAGGTYVSSGISKVGTSGWFLVWVTGILSAGNATPAPALVLNAGTASQGMFIWGMGVVPGTAPPAQPPTYFQTTTAAGPRAADSAVIQHTGIGTLVFTFDDGSTQTIFTNPAAQVTIPVNLNRRLITRMTGYATTAPFRQAVGTTLVNDVSTSAAQLAFIQGVTTVVRMDTVKLVFPNFFATSETSTGGTLTVKASVEYPTGVFTPVTFGGLATGSTSGPFLTSDEVSVSIPAGAVPNIRGFATNSNSTFPIADNSSNSILVTQSGATVPDITAGGTLTQTTNRFNYGASVVAARHNQRAVVIYADSIGYGIGAQSNVGNATAPYNGLFVPSLAGIVSVANFSSPGDSVANFIVHGTNKVAMAQYFTSACTNLGVNDLNAGRTGAQVIADRATMAGQLPIPLLQSTITPSATSTDDFATATGQTTLGYNSQRVIVNANVRAMPVYLEVTIPLEDGLNSGIWKNPGDATAAQALTDTADPWLGLHPNFFAYGLVKTFGGVNPAFFP